MTTKRDAVRSAQSILTGANPALRVDGLWGPATDGTFVKAPLQMQLRVENSVQADGFDLSAIRSRFIESGTWIDAAAARAIADRASADVGIDPSYLRFLLEFEPARRIAASGTQYNVQSLSPNREYKGLFQLGAPAWTDARRYAPKIGSFDANWRDPYLNAVAAAAFAKANSSYARQKHAYKGPLTNEVLYAMHNQGHSFLASARQGGKGYYFDDQSKTAKTLLTKAAEVVRNA